MNIAGVTQSSEPLTLAGSRLTQRLAGDSSFARELEAAGATDRSTLRQAATQLVSSALLMPVMQLMAESPLAAGPFAPGSAEKHFQPLLHQHLTERITEAANFPIVDAIVDRYAPPAQGVVNALG